MLPCLVHGDTVLIHASHKNLHAGDIVLVRHPHKNVTIVKRIAKIHADGRLELLGDNPPESTDSRHFGFVSVDAVLGKVVSRFP